MFELDVISWIWIVGYYTIALAFLVWIMWSLDLWKDVFPKFEED